MKHSDVDKIIEEARKRPQKEPSKAELEAQAQAWNRMAKSRNETNLAEAERIMGPRLTEIELRLAAIEEELRLGAPDAATHPRPRKRALRK